ncbi:arsenosugar biosynthesis radical SAM (seleno)protein ArsS [Candidatus Spongiihabitans sp.]|uniref:arsenosugar biosynthesis radical SAM (seleno)protein ArsS n=1 Tax=Candidatus Spongiihabitans sp. TaxID=3101308 RepID=UPI003C7A7286
MDINVHHDFNQALKAHNHFPLRRAALSELQINVGYLCNQACAHCHVDAGPKRTEMMAWATMQKILDWASNNSIKSVDITGGAPELIPNFRKFCDGFVAQGISITSRCNITVQYEPGQEDLPQWYAERKIRLVCSLPCYTSKNVDQQRGKGVFGKSISGLQAFNAAGYGRTEELTIDLVYNPIGPVLPPAQTELQNDYKTRLKQDFDIDFNRLLTITNLPINRFEHYLNRTGQSQSYHRLLAENFNPAAVEALMCRHLINVDWQGYVYDCDFNQMLGLPLAAPGRKQGRNHGRKQLWEIASGDLEDGPIAVAKHCFGCTAGAGSSCGGALT